MGKLSDSVSEIGLVTDNADLPCFEPGSVVIYAPAVAALARILPLEIAGLPLGNVNQQTLANLKSLTPADRKHVFCGIFVLDPLTNWSEFGAAVRRAGIGGLCNCPALPAFGEAEQTSLAASGYSYALELAALRDLASNDLALAIYGATEGHRQIARDTYHNLATTWRLIHSLRKT